MKRPPNAKSQTIGGIEYVYFDTAIWDKKNQRGKHKRQYIGKMLDGKFVPNQKYLIEKHPEALSDTSVKPGPVPALTCQRLFYGATYLLDCIGQKAGITADLKACFPYTYKQILSVVYFLVLEEGIPMYRFPKWAKTHKHPFGEELPSRRISDILGIVDEEAKMQFFRHQAKRRNETEFLAYDTTSISSYSETLKQARYGVNKEGDSLKQINLALLCGEKSKLPVYYRKLTGNTSDVKTVLNLLKDIEFLNLVKLNLVMDRGFYSEENINELMRQHHKFLIGAKLGLKIVKSVLDEVRGSTMFDWSHYDEETGLYTMTFTKEWNYKEIKPRKGETLEDKRRIYVHLYYNDQRCADERLTFAKKLTRLEQELLTGERNPAHETSYEQYFVVKETPKRGITVKPKQDAIDEAQKNFGYFALMTNGVKDPQEAVRIYRFKDTVEKSFGNLKDRLAMRRMSVSSEEHFEAKLFIQFIALIYLAYIKKGMEDAKLFKNYTLQELLDELDVIEYYQQPGREHHLSEISKRQAGLYQQLGFKTPA